MLIGALVIGVLVGSLTGLLGAGGAIIALPLLVYALGIPMADAVPMMLAVGVLSPISALLPRLRTDVDWRSVAAVGAAGMPHFASRLYGSLRGETCGIGGKAPTLEYLRNLRSKAFFVKHSAA